jgi:hypothetical protein
MLLACLPNCFAGRTQNKSLTVGYSKMAGGKYTMVPKRAVISAMAFCAVIMRVQSYQSPFVIQQNRARSLFQLGSLGRVMYSRGPRFPPASPDPALSDPFRSAQPELDIKLSA